MTMDGLPNLSLREHLELAEGHTQKALNLAHHEEPQSVMFLVALGRAQAILLGLYSNVRRWGRA